MKKAAFFCAALFGMFMMCVGEANSHCSYGALINSSPCSAEVYVISTENEYGPFQLGSNENLHVDFTSTTEDLKGYRIDGCEYDVPWLLTVTCIDICSGVCTVTRQLCITSDPCTYEIK